MKGLGDDSTGKTEMYFYVEVFPLGGRLARLGRIMLCI